MEYSSRLTKSIPKENQLKILNKMYQTYLVSTAYSPPLESLLNIVNGKQIGQYSLTQNLNILIKTKQHRSWLPNKQVWNIVAWVTHTVHIVHTKNHLVIKQTYCTFS